MTLTSVPPPDALGAPDADLTVPDAGPDRFRLHRAGVLNVWQYDDQEFSFADGRLLLRGANGAGKSKTLEMLLPFALDGDKAKITASAKHHTSLLWLMTDGYEGQARIGYVWVEFARTDESGAAAYFTCGVGIRASASARTATAWHFATPRRVGDDLHLEDASGPLPRSRLVEELGDGGAIFEKAAAYKEYVGKTLFGLDPTQFDEVLRLLYWLRQPQVGEDIEPVKLAQQLSVALPQLDEQGVRTAGETFDELVAFGEQLERRAHAADALATLAAAYRGYARAVVGERARGLTQALRAERRLRSAVRNAETTLTDREAEHQAAQTQRTAASAAVDDAAARLRSLQASPEFRNSARLAELGERAEQDAASTERLRERRDQRAAAADRRIAAETQRRTALTAQLRDVAEAVRHLDARLRDRVPDASLPVPPGLGEQSLTTATPPEDVAQVLQTVAEAGSRSTGHVTQRQAAVTVVRAALSAADRAAADQRSADRDADAAESRWESARKARVEAADQVARAEATLREELRGWLVDPVAPDPPPAVPEQIDAAVLAALPDAARRAAAPALKRLREESAAVTATRLAAEAAIESLRDERRAVAERSDPAPPAAPLPRTARPDGAALWQVVDFRDGITAQEQAGIEAALQDAGLLDAWVRPGGKLLDPEFRDVLLEPRDSGHEHNSGTGQNPGDGQTPGDEQTSDAGQTSGAGQTSDAGQTSRDEQTSGDGQTSGSGQTSGDEHTSRHEQNSRHERNVRSLSSSKGRHHRLGSDSASGPVRRLDEVLVADLPQDAAGLTLADVDAVLRRIGFGGQDDCDTWVDAAGGWRTGAAVGRSAKDEAQFIGATARAAERARRLAAIDASLTEQRGIVEQATQLLHSLATAQERLDDWISAVPRGQQVIPAWTRLEERAAAADRAEAANRAAQAAAQQARSAAAVAHSELERIAAAAQLPAQSEGLAAAEQALRDLAQGLHDLDAQVRDTRRTAERWSDAVGEAELARADLAAEEQALLAATGRSDTSAAELEALRAAVGASVRELETAIAAARADESTGRRAVEAADQRIAAVLESVGEARADARSATERLSEQVRQRSDVMARVVALTAVPGLLAAAGVAESLQELADLEPATAVPRQLLGVLDAAAGVSDEESVPAGNRVWGAHREAMSGPAADHAPTVFEYGDLMAVTGTDDGGEAAVVTLAERVASAVARDRELLTEREKTQFEQHVLGELGDAIRTRRRDAHELVTAMNQQLARITTSQGIRVRLDWKLRDDVPAEARSAVDLLAQPVGALVPEERAALRDALHRLIEASRSENPALSYSEHLSAALDYRRWYEFTIRYQRPEHPGRWDRLHRRSALSQGEQKVLCYLPLFAAAAAHFTSLAGAAPWAPRLVLLDDAFPKIDIRTHPLLFGLLVDLDLDFVITSERLWGDCETVPSLAIYEALRDPNQRGIAQYEYRWDGRSLHALG